MTVEDGLTTDEAARRLQADGANELVREARKSRLRLLVAQVGSPLIWLLLGACTVSAALGAWLDASAILAIVVINAVVGFLQEHRAETAILALRAATAPRARVQRDGHAAVISATDVVVGDRLLLEAGDVVAADGRLVEAHHLSLNEASLTGESVPVEKRTTPSAPDAPLAERYDQIFMGTAVAAGTGVAEIAATGMRTQLGRVAHLLATAEETVTPLQARLARVSRVLLLVCLGIVALVAAAGLAHGTPLLEVFLSAVSLAVAAVPEGLPAIVTIALAVGVTRMAARNVLVRRLPAVETLGCTTVICTDKTGTLTTGVMTVREVWGPDPDEVIAVAAACCDAELGPEGRGGVGDPTELAILADAASRGVQRAELERANPRRLVHPFDAERKLMSIERTDGRLYVKGAVEVVLARLTSPVPAAATANERMTQRGLRVLAVALGTGPAEEELRLVGLIGIADPPRSEAIAAVAAARAAGIRTIMITGDHPTTARAIARELGILQGDEAPEERVHARATPEDKLAIVRAWKTRGEVVAMTGDGVNDAPALREAHVGIAMGRTGVEVTREASDMVLADDNFASIVAAVREGRGIFDNIRKALVYLLAGNAAELAIMLAAAAAGLPLPLLPLQLLWVNLVTDGLPALALVLDPPRRDALSRPPRDPREPMIGARQWRTIVAIGALQAAVTFGGFTWVLHVHDLAAARSLAFAALVFGQLLLVLAVRDPARLYWEAGPFSNLKLVGVVVVSLLAQLAIHAVPFTQRLFGVGPLSLTDVALAAALGLVPVSVVELTKLVRRRRQGAHHATL